MNRCRQARFWLHVCNFLPESDSLHQRGAECVFGHSSCFFESVPDSLNQVASPTLAGHRAVVAVSFAIGHMIPKSQPFYSINNVEQIDSPRF